MGQRDSPGKLPASAMGATVLIAAVWGFNFVVIRVGVSAMPSLMLAALRFAFSALPAVFAFSSAGSMGGMGLPLLLMILLASFGRAGANVAAKKMPGINSLGLMVWSSLFSPLPLAALSLAFEGPRALRAALAGPGLLTVGALAYLVLLSTLLGYGPWSHLIVRHGAGRIATFSLMVPIFGLASASLFLGERFTLVDAAGAALVVAGLLVHVFGGRSRAQAARRGT
jgi:O-acetylserine/cysteine efflux transporter